MDVLNALVTVSEKIKRYISEQLRVVDKKFEDQQTAIAANTDAISKKPDESWVTEKIQAATDSLQVKIDEKPSTVWVTDEIKKVSDKLSTDIAAKPDEDWVKAQISGAITTDAATQAWVKEQIQAAIDSTWGASY